MRPYQVVQALVFTVFFCLILLPFETKTDLCRSGGLFQDLRAVFDLVTCFGIVDRLVHAGFIPLRPPDKAITDIAGTAGGNGDFHLVRVVHVFDLGRFIVRVRYDDAVAAVALVTDGFRRQRLEVLVKLVARRGTGNERKGCQQKK